MLNYAALLMTVLAFIGTAAFRISMPAVAFYTRSVLEASALGVGLLTSSFFAARALASVVTGAISDRLGRRVAYLAAASFLTNALIVQLYAYVGSVELVIAVRFAQGWLNGLAWVPTQYLLGRSVRESFRGRAYSIYFTLGFLGGVAGNALYSLLADQPLTAALNVSSALYAASAVITLVVAEVLKRHPAPEVRRVEKTAGSPGSSGSSTGYSLLSIIPLVVIVVGTGLFASIVKGDLIYVYIREAYSVPKGAVANFIALAGLASLASGYLISWISDRVSDALSLRISALLSALGAILISVRYLPATLLGLAIFYTSTSGIVPVSRRVAVTKYRLRGSALGIVNASSNVGSVIGTSIAGYLYDALGEATVGVLGAELTVFLAVMSLATIASLLASLTLSRE